jgi:hypothetical protein
MGPATFRAALAQSQPIIVPDPPSRVVDLIRDSDFANESLKPIILAILQRSYESAESKIKTAASTQSLSSDELSFASGLLAYYNGNFKDAEAAYKNLYDSKPGNTRAAIDYAAMLYYRGDLKGAKEICGRAAAVVEGDLLWAMEYAELNSILGACFLSEGAFAEARSAFWQAAMIVLVRNNGFDLDCWGQILDVASTRVYEDRNAEMKALFKWLYDEYSKLPTKGRDPVTCASFLTNYAAAIVEENESSAYEMYSAALGIRRSYIPDTHPEVAQALVNVATASNDVDEIIGNCLLALPVQVKEFGVNSPTIGFTYLRLAQGYELKHDSEKAREFYGKVEAVIDTNELSAENFLVRRYRSSFNNFQKKQD